MSVRTALNRLQKRGSLRPIEPFCQNFFGKFHPIPQLASVSHCIRANPRNNDSHRLGFQRRYFGAPPDDLEEVLCKPLLTPAGVVCESPGNFIPQNALYENQGRTKKRVLILCTGGTITMAPDPKQNGALAPVQGALSKYMSHMDEFNQEDSEVPDYFLHEYSFWDSSDFGPADWTTLAKDIESNYLHFDGFVVLTGTDTMAYIASALSFMLENLNKPVVFTGSQIPLCMPQTDARRNLIMAMIFASRDSINEVCIFFHDRLLRANRTTKVNTHKLLAFDSPNMSPLATIGISIDENDHLLLPPARGALRVHKRMDPRLLTIRLVPGFDDEMIRQMIEINTEKQQLRALVLQLYGTGNIPSVKESFIQLLADATDNGILVIASTQCFTGSVLMGQYATGRALLEAGAVSAGDMTLEAIACKCAYLFGRRELTTSQIVELMNVSLRGEMTPNRKVPSPSRSSSF